MQPGAVATDIRDNRLFGPPRLIPEPAFGGPGNDDMQLTPRPSQGRGGMEFDFPGISVGTAEYSEGPTGVTVIDMPAGVKTAVDARGGSYAISGGGSVNYAICLAGGSIFGLSAGGGVAAELLRRNGNKAGFGEVKPVPSAVIYDMSARANAVTPDAALGRAALENAKPGYFPIGRAGAGASASAGKVTWARTEFCGQGAAFERFGGVKVLAAVVTNPVGVIVSRDGSIVRGNYNHESGRRRHLAEDYQDALASGQPPQVEGGNTTLSIVLTNARMDDHQLNQFGKQVHTSMGRAIQPFQTMSDGDVLFAMTTDEVDLTPAESNQDRRAPEVSTAVGALAAEVMWDAILESAR